MLFIKLRFMCQLLRRKWFYKCCCHDRMSVSVRYGEIKIIKLSNWSCSNFDLWFDPVANCYCYLSWDIEEDSSGSADCGTPQGQIQVILTWYLLPQVFWHLNKMLKNQLYTGNHSWESKWNSPPPPPLLPVDCKSKIVLTPCFPSKLGLWQKKMLSCHIRDKLIHYWSLREVWTESRNSWGYHGIGCFWSVITWVLTPNKVRCVRFSGWYS